MADWELWLALDCVAPPDLQGVEAQRVPSTQAERSRVETTSTASCRTRSHLRRAQSASWSAQLPLVDQCQGSDGRLRKP